MITLHLQIEERSGTVVPNFRAFATKGDLTEPELLYARYIASKLLITDEECSVLPPAFGFEARKLSSVCEGMKSDKQSDI